MSPDERAEQARDPRGRPAKRAAAAIGALVVLAAAGAVFVASDRDRASVADRGRALFTKTFTPEEGLGPLFNDRSCAGCHFEPTLGGMGRGGVATVLRVGQLTESGFDDYLIYLRSEGRIP